MLHGYLEVFLRGFETIDLWISLSFYMDFAKLLHGFVKAVSWICQSCSLYFSLSSKENEADVSKFVEASALN